MGKKDEVMKTLTDTSIKTKDFKFNRKEANTRDGKWKKVADEMNNE